MLPAALGSSIYWPGWTGSSARLTRLLGPRLPLRHGCNWTPASAQFRSPNGDVRRERLRPCGGLRCEYGPGRRGSCPSPARLHACVGALGRLLHVDASLKVIKIGRLRCWFAYCLCMDIRELLLTVAATYDKTKKAARGVPAQDLLRAAPQHLGALVPAGLEIEGYGGQGDATYTPWIGVYDPDITRDPKYGLYLAYIFATDLESVTLTLQQGITRLQVELQTRGEKLRTPLAQTARQLFKQLPQSIVNGWDHRPEFKDKGWRALAYEASSVAARQYVVSNMPEEKELREDLWRMAEVLQQAAVITGHDWVGQQEREVIEYVPESPYPEYEGLEGFRPKDDGDYTSEIAVRQQLKTRRHETLIREFGPYIHLRGFTPVTEGVHPRDLVLSKQGREWLVEAKVVKSGNPTKAVREAVAQLLEYGHFLYKGEVNLRLVGLFTEDVGVYVDYLEVQGIASVWKIPGGWAGSRSAIDDGLVASKS